MVMRQIQNVAKVAQVSVQTKQEPKKSMRQIFQSFFFLVQNEVDTSHVNQVEIIQKLYSSPQTIVEV